jgi:hypothetical protein
MKSSLPQSVHDTFKKFLFKKPHDVRKLMKLKITNTIEIPNRKELMNKIININEVT